MKKHKRLAVLLLAAAMTLPLAACEKGSPSVNMGEEYAYVPEYIQMKEDMRLQYMQLLGESMYYMSDSYDNVMQRHRWVLCEYSLVDKKTTREIHMAAAEAEERRNLSVFHVLENGTFLTIENIYKTDSNTVLLCAYDGQGNRTYEADISDKVKDESEYGYVDAMLVDGEGRIYIQAGECVCLFGQDYSYQGKFASDSWIDTLCMDADGKIYGVYYEGSLDARNYCLAEIDFAGRKWGTVYHNFPQGRNVVAGKDEDFLIWDDYGVYAYDMEKQTGEKLFDWLDSDINGDYVDSLNVTEGGRMVIVIRDWESGEINLTFLDKKKIEELPQKTEIVVAAITSRQELQAAAVAFNKQSDAYHVSIKNYVDDHTAWTESTYSDAVNRLKSDLVSGSNSPDIIYLDANIGNIEKLALNGAFEDLLPYLEKSSVLSKDDYLENVLGAYAYGDRLVGIPRTFSVRTIVGKTSDFEGKESWTVEDMAAYADAHPGKELLEYATKQYILSVFLMCNSKLYVDYSTGKCNFNSKEFQSLLAFVDNFPGEYEWDEDDQRSTPLKLQAGDVLLEMVSISRFDEIQLCEAMFGESVTCIGFPTVEGGNGSILSVMGGVGISAKAKSKEGAWAFMEHYLTEESRLYGWGIPASKNKMQEAIEEAMEDTGRRSIGYSDWEYEYHALTQSEVDMVVKLIESATVESASDEQILSIIMEEAESFFQGQKSVEDVTNIIQRRVQLYLDENQ